MIYELRFTSSARRGRVRRSIIASVVVATSAFNLQPSTAFAQGSLTPPGAPAPTMKSLDQIEPRTPVDSTHTPGDGGNEFIISQSGSYYLTTNIVGVSGKYGIEITTNNVALDLKGFALLGTPTSSSGINVSASSCTNIMVRNGTISGWSNGGYFGLFCLGRNATFEHLTISGNDYGLGLVDDTLVRGCIVNYNNRNGIDISGSNSLIQDNVCNGNNILNAGGLGGIAIGGSNNRIEGNSLVGNGAAGFGIAVQGFAFTNNIIVRNFVTGNGANDIISSSPQITGPLITNAVSGFITNSNPWSNFSF